jgi:hypothetical protein
MTTRRFPPPWSVEDIGAAFVVKDSNGQVWRRMDCVLKATFTALMS